MFLWYKIQGVNNMLYVLRTGGGVFWCQAYNKCFLCGVAHSGESAKNAFIVLFQGDFGSIREKTAI